MFGHTPRVPQARRRIGRMGLHAYSRRISTWSRLRVGLPAVRSVIRLHQGMGPFVYRGGTLGVHDRDRRSTSLGQHMNGIGTPDVRATYSLEVLREWRERERFRERE